MFTFSLLTFSGFVVIVVVDVGLIDVVVFIVVVVVVVVAAAAAFVVYFFCELRCFISFAFSNASYRYVP